eukprot:jgi/Mesvir1/13422/Mv16500-RA.1
MGVNRWAPDAGILAGVRGTHYMSYNNRYGAFEQVVPGLRLSEGYKIKASDYSGDSVGAREFLQDRLYTSRQDVATVCQLPPHGKWSEHVWQVENLRHMVLEMSLLLTRMEDVCTREFCPVMKATDEWTFLCAAHRLPQECCAIDYIQHTVEGAAAVLTSEKLVTAEDSPAGSLNKVLQSLARRLHRVLAHVFFHHRELFDEFERETFLCERFLYFVKTYKLVPKDLLIIPKSYFVKESSNS